MKKSGGRKSNTHGARALIVIALVAVIVAAVLWVVSPGKLGNTPGDLKDNDKVGDNVHSVANQTKNQLLSDSDLPDATTPVQLVNESGTTVITLNGSSATVSGAGAVVDGGYILINRAGIYELSGTLNDGRIVVNAKGEDVVLVFNGVDITCKNSSALFVRRANSVTLIANGTSENIFTDGSNYDFSLEHSSDIDKEPNAAIFSKADLIIRGTGTFKVNGKYSAGIISKDNLKIVNTTVDVDAVNNGINGKDSLTIQNSTVNVVSGNDGLRSTQNNDALLGYAVFTGSNIYVNTKGDAVQIETGLTIDNCSISLTAGGGSKSQAVDSQKGIKCNQGYVNINSGNIIMNCADDAINARGNVTVSGGLINLYSADDGIHSDSNIYINGGDLVVVESNEALEGMSVEITEGNVSLTSRSDGINASVGSDNLGGDGMGGQLAYNPDNNITISGGFVWINAGGDGMDSNGNIYLSDGTLIINGPTSGADGAIDYNGDFFCTGGTLMAVGSAALAETPDNFNGNYCISLTFDSELSAGTYISISGNGQSFVFKTEKAVENIVFASPILASGKEYTVSYGGKYSGGEVNGNVCTGGKYSGGKDIKLTISDDLVVYGRVGMGGSVTGGIVGEAGAVKTFHGEGKQP